MDPGHFGHARPAREIARMRLGEVVPSDVRGLDLDGREPWPPAAPGSVADIAARHGVTAASGTAPAVREQTVMTLRGYYE